MRPQTNLQLSKPENFTDLSVGSRQFGIRPPVFLESSVLKDYRELECAMGLNTAGLILSVLAYRLAGLSEDETLVICLRRQIDARPVELELHMQFVRVDEALALVLRQGAERPAGTELIVPAK